MISHVRRNAVAYLALFVALGGTATAATLAKNSVGNAQLKSNAVTSAKVKNGSLRAADFKAGDLPRGATGAAGTVGPAGATGPAGPAGASALWAILRADGSIVRASGVVNVSRIDAGRYLVAFNRSVVGCAESVQLGGFTVGGEVQQPSVGQAAAGVVSSGTDAANAVVTVLTSDSGGTLADRAFHLAVLC
jgi:hypothetical protein